jgi:N-carbamoyl-L-amino-acid hydrolase
MPASKAGERITMTSVTIDSTALLSRLHILGEIGRDEEGGLTRLAASDTLGTWNLVLLFRQCSLRLMSNRVRYLRLKTN